MKELLKKNLQISKAEDFYQESYYSTPVEVADIIFIVERQFISCNMIFFDNFLFEKTLKFKMRMTSPRNLPIAAL